MNKVVVDTIRKNKEPFLELNREQLSKGIKTDKQRVSNRGYSAGWRRQRQKRNLQVSYVDLKYTGETYKKMDYFVTSTRTLFFSRTPYAEHLEKRYASKRSHIFGLTEESKNKAMRLNHLPVMLVQTKKHVFYGM